jgi:hypothetical protein
VINVGNYGDVANRRIQITPITFNLTGPTVLEWLFSPETARIL